MKYGDLIKQITEQRAAQGFGPPDAETNVGIQLGDWQFSVVATFVEGDGSVVFVFSEDDIDR